MFKKEPAILIGAILSIVVLIVQVLDGELDLAQALQAMTPIISGLFIRQAVYSPDSVEEIRTDAKAEGIVQERKRLT